MPYQNRVTPRGELIAVAARGIFMGNRGCLHDKEGRIRRNHRGERWIICDLEFKGRHIPVMHPGFFTHLFFLDEAVALAAGHRPCMECRRPAFRAYAQAWAAAHPEAAGAPRPAAAIDRVLHLQRTSEGETAPLETLPDGAFVALPGDPRAFLVLGDALLEWTPTEYASRVARPAGTVEVLTPRASVGALRAGYRPVLHESVNRF